MNMETRRKSHQDLSSLKVPHRPSQSNFLVASRSKATTGFRLFQNLPFQRKVWLILIAVCIFTATFWFTLPLSSEISLDSVYTLTGEAPTITTDPTTNTAILYLQRPQRPFHGNHWYHIGEYYISQHAYVTQLLAEQNALHNTHIRHLKLVVHDYRLSDWLSKMSFALIVLSCIGSSGSDENGGVHRIQTVELFAASSLQYHTLSTHHTTPQTLSHAHHTTHTTTNKHATYSPTDLQNSTILTVIEYKHPLYGYYHLPSDRAKFVDYAHNTANMHNNANNIDRRAIFSDTIEPYAPVHIVGSALRWYRQWQLNPSDLSVYCGKNPCREMLYVGAIGAVPVLPVEWFGSHEQAAVFRSNALSVCGIQSTAVHATGSTDGAKNADDTHTTHHPHDTIPHTIHTTSTTADTPRVYNLVVYQRDLNRRFIHLNKVIEALRSRVQTINNTNTHTNTNIDTDTESVVWNIEILRHREDAEPCALLNILKKADILLTAHGFQSTALMFMRPGSVIIEIFPYKYHRTTYLPLARIFGLHYRSIQNTAPTMHGSSGMIANLVSAIDANRPSTQLLRVISQGACMRDLECRSYARSRDINMPTSHIELVLKTMHEVQTSTLDPYAPLLG